MATICIMTVIHIGIEKYDQITEALNKSLIYTLIVVLKCSCPYIKCVKYHDPNPYKGWEITQNQ